MRRETADGRGQDWASLTGFAHRWVRSSTAGAERRGLNNKGAKKRIKLEKKRVGGRMRHDTPDGRGQDWASLTGFAHRWVRSSTAGAKRGGIEQQRR